MWEFQNWTNMLAQSIARTQPVTPDNWTLLLAHLIAAIVFAIVGVVVFFGMLLLMEKITPFSIVHEIGEEHNTAVALIIGAIVLGMSIIIAAAILG